MSSPGAILAVENNQGGRKFSKRWAIAVFVAAFAFFAMGLSSEPLFPDESAYVAQSYYLDLLIQGKRDDWAWVEYHAYDLPPLPKYLFGLALRTTGLGAPGDRATAAKWFYNINAPLAPRASILAARLPSLALGALGCVAICSLGTALGGTRLGLVSALLLMLNPLYRLHARRAMSDVHAECFIMAAEACALAVWCGVIEQRSSIPRTLVSWFLVGVLFGLALLSKLNGLLAGIVIVAWVALGLSLPRLAQRGRGLLVIGLPIVMAAGLGIIVVLNPYVTAQPKSVPPRNLMNPVAERQSIPVRLLFLIEHRVNVSADGQLRFPHNALKKVPDKVLAVAVQGFGRFGPLGPRAHDSARAYDRFDLSRDWGAILWLPWVAAGCVWAIFRGRAQQRAGMAPTASAILILFCISLATVTAFIPLAWDRYYMSIQPGATLIGAGMGVAAVDQIIRRCSRPKG